MEHSDQHQDLPESIDPPLENNHSAMNPANFPDNEAAELVMEEFINKNFNKINDLLGAPMRNRHRTSFRSLVTQTIRTVLGVTSFPVSFGTFSDNEKKAQDVAKVFIAQYAEQIWPRSYIGSMNRVSQQYDQQVKDELGSYVMKLFGSNKNVDEEGEKTSQDLVKDLITLYSTFGLEPRGNDVNSEPRVHGERSALPPASVARVERDGVDVFGKQGRNEEEQDREFEATFEERRLARRELFDGYLSSGDEG